MNFLTSDDKVKLYFDLTKLMKNKKKPLNSVVWISAIGMVIFSVPVLHPQTQKRKLACTA